MRTYIERAEKVSESFARRKRTGGSGGGVHHERVTPIRALLKTLADHLTELEEHFEDVHSQERDAEGGVLSIYHLILRQLRDMQALVDQYKRKTPPCREVRSVTRSYLSFFETYRDDLADSLDNPVLFREWESHNADLRTVCR
jgi:hypothetical protein